MNGIFLEYSRRYFNSVIQKLKDQGCDAVVLGCTEIPLLVDAKSPLPVSTPPGCWPRGAAPLEFGIGWLLDFVTLEI